MDLGTSRDQLLLTLPSHRCVGSLCAINISKPDTDAGLGAGVIQLTPHCLSRLRQDTQVVAGKSAQPSTERRCAL